MHAILTSSDAGCGDFLARHWLPSLRANVDLHDVDVVVLDHGLTAEQRAGLEGARVVPVRSDAPAKVARYAMAARFLAEAHYDQVLTVDGGDVIFQSDVRPLFDRHRESFRGVLERFPVPLFLLLGGSPLWLRRRIRRQMRGRRMVNVGFLLGPAEAHRRLGAHMVPFEGLLQHDQPFVNAFLHDWGFVELDPTYNFVPWTASRAFRVREGRFLGADGEPFKVVHNTGLRQPFRVVGDFGYGPGRNTEIRTSYLRLAAVYGRVRSLGRAQRA